MCKNLEIVSDKKKRVQSRACALTRRTNDILKIPLERTTRLAHSRSPIKVSVHRLFILYVACEVITVGGRDR